MPNLRLTSLAFLLALAVPATAQAAPKLLLDATTVLDAPLAAGAGEAAGACHRAYRPGAAGVAARDVRLSGPGSLEVRLDGDEGDWDVAVFDAAGRLLAADASPDAQEVASGFALEGGVVHVQACRRSGDAASVPATLEHSAIAPGAAEAAKAAKPQLVDVITPTKEQKRRLLALDLDMTEHGGDESLGVVLHGAEDKAALRKAGLRWTVEVADLVARDAADRASERRARAAAIPSGRTSYRTLADYNAELKDLAAKNPNLVKLFTMPEKTYGGKDVLGIEISENVNRNDGKPAFFNMGVHHAREWPAGELTMEWALELVNGYKRVPEPLMTKGIEEGRINLVEPIIKVAPGDNIGMMFFGAKFIEKSGGDIATRWLMAYLEGIRFAQNPKNRDEVIKIVAKETRLEPDLVGKIYDRRISWPQVEPNGRVDAERMLKTLGNFFLEAKQIDKLPDARRVFDPTQLQAALKQVGEVRNDEHLLCKL